MNNNKGLHNKAYVFCKNLELIKLYIKIRNIATTLNQPKFTTVLQLSLLDRS